MLEKQRNTQQHPWSPRLLKSLQRFCMAIYAKATCKQWSFATTPGIFGGNGNAHKGLGKLHEYHFPKQIFTKNQTAAEDEPWARLRQVGSNPISTSKPMFLFVSNVATENTQVLGLKEYNHLQPPTKGSLQLRAPSGRSAEGRRQDFIQHTRNSTLLPRSKGSHKLPCFPQLIIVL